MLRGLLAFSFACSLEEKAQMNFWDPVGGRNNNLLKLERQRPDYTANYTELVMRALKVEQQLSLLVLAQGRRNKWPKTTTNELVWPRLVCKTTFQKLKSARLFFLERIFLSSRSLTFAKFIYPGFRFPALQKSCKLSNSSCSSTLWMKIAQNCTH